MFFFDAITKFFKLAFHAVLWQTSPFLLLILLLSWSSDDLLVSDIELYD